MKKKFVSLILLSSLLVAGCSGNDEVERLNNLSSLYSETSNVSTNNYSLSYSDKQEMVYAQVSDRTMLDLSTLVSCTDNEIQQVVNFMNKVDEQLVGAVSAEDGVLEESFINYLLAEFEKTPYYWQRTKTTVRGIDDSSRAIVVDVDYKTLNYNKTVKPDSKIALGENSYRKKLEIRFNKYLALLDSKINGDITYTSQLKSFENAYGSVKEILNEQSSDSLSDYIYNTGNQKTYSGVVNTDLEKIGGTMTVRYVLVPKYSLGINLGMECKHMYVTNYKIDSDPTENLALFKEDGYIAVTDNLYKMLYSYLQCLDECDYTGLYKLTYKFNSVDKYYKDMFDTTYRKNENFTLSLFDIQGTHISCGVTVASKIRPKGSKMTFPTYTDRYYVDVELIDGELKVKNMVLLSRVIQSEPAIKTLEADTSGFTATIDLDNDDKLSIEALLCDFGVLQLAGDSKSDKFGEVVDLSMTTSDLEDLRQNMDLIKGNQKAVWISSYQQGTSNYASVRCRELYQNGDNNITEADVTYDFIKKGSKWYIFRFTVNSSIKLDTTNLSTSGTLCLVNSEEVVSYVSQVQSTVSSAHEAVSDTSVVFTHSSYKPVKKNKKSQQGVRKLTIDDMNEKYYNLVADNCKDTISYSSYCDKLDKLESMGISASDAKDIRSIFDKIFVFSVNVVDGRYSKDEYYEVVSDYQLLVSNAKTKLIVEDEDASDLYSIINEMFRNASLK